LCTCEFREGPSAVRRRGSAQHARMSELQHARIVDVAAEMLAELGYGRITVEQIAVRAGISRKTFYEHFEEREGCLIAAIEEGREPRNVPSFVPTEPEIESLGREGGGPNGRARSRDMPGFRITYRTVRVIEAIGVLNERGLRPSNREVAEVAGITDESHISRILRRLEGRGVLLRDGGPAHAKRSRGEANAWRLTAWGEEVRMAVERPARPRVPAPVK
jgi:AcrR family transcriptional regulator